jgi:argininosuccinate lyase
VKLVTAAMTTAEFDAERLEARAGDGWTTLTELADTLVRDHEVPFRTAHAIAARLIAARQQDPARPLSALVADASRDLVGVPLEYSEAALAEILSPRHFVAVRTTPGGPAPEETARAIAASRAQLEADRQWWTNATDALASAERRLAERSAKL